MDYNNSFSIIFVELQNVEIMGMLKIILIIVASICAFLFLFGIFFLLISVLHDTYGRKEETFRNKLTKARKYLGKLQWFDGLKSEGIVTEEYITNHDKLRLHAYFIPKKNAVGTVILVHGYSGCALQTIPQARVYREDLNFNVVMVNLAHHAQSEGRVTQMGWKDRLDVIQWIDVVNEKFLGADGQPLPVILHGISMGGSTVMMASGEPMPANVKGIINENGFQSAEVEFIHEINTKLHLPGFPFFQAANFAAKCFLGWAFTDADAIKMVKKSVLPIFIIHGNCDERVPVSNGKNLFAAKEQGYKEIWIVPGGDHITTVKQYPEEYVKRVGDFIQKALSTSID